MISVDEAIEVFVRGFCFTRSFTHPYIPKKLKPHVWLMRDGPRSSGDYRSDEYAAHDVSPEVLHTLAQKHSTRRYRICALLESDSDDSALRRDFKELGYRLTRTEAFMANDLRRISSVSEPAPIRRVETEEEATLLAKAAGSRQILPKHLTMEPPPMCEYVARDADALAGWVGSVAVGDCRWCTNMFVQPSHRRRGIARALMTRMLNEDRAAGAKANVLLASHTGSKLYPLVGYEQIGTLYIFVPRRG